MLPRYAVKIQVSKYSFYIQRNLKEKLSLIPVECNINPTFRYFIFSLFFFFFFKSFPRIGWPVTNNRVSRQLPQITSFSIFPNCNNLLYVDPALPQPILGNWMREGYKCLDILAQHRTLWWSLFTWSFVKYASQFNFFLCPILFSPSFHRYRTLSSILQSKLLLSTCLWRTQPLME